MDRVIGLSIGSFLVVMAVTLTWMFWPTTEYHLALILHQTAWMIIGWIGIYIILRR